MWLSLSSLILCNESARMIVLILPDIPTEDRLLAQARQGDQDAVMQIYEQYFPPIYQYIRLRTDDPQAAEDIASDVFLTLVRELRGRNAPRHSLRGWLFRVARSELSRHYGKRQRMPTTTLEDWLPAADDLGDPEAQLMQTLDLQRARRALRMLSPDQQEVLVLRFGQMLNLEQTADVMGKSVSAIKSLQFRAVNTLRQILGDMREGVAYG